MEIKQCFFYLNLLAHFHVNSLSFKRSHRRCSVKIGVVLQISQENTGVGVQLYLKETPAQVFSSEIFEIIKNTYLVEHLRTAASVPLNILNFP